MALKNPSELFEQKRLESIQREIEEAQRKLEEQEKLKLQKVKKIKAPKELFRKPEDIVAPIQTEEIVEIKEEIIEEVVEDSNIKEELSKFFETKILQHTETIEEKLEEKFNEYSEKVQGTLQKKSKNIIDEFNSTKQDLIKKVTDLEIDILRNENHLRSNNVDVDLIYNDIAETIHKLKSEIVDDIMLNEGLLNEPPNVKNRDPLTPLDQNYVTLDHLNQHYKLFINRIQQQLSTLGGGGETRFEFLDDIDRDSVKQDKYVIQYDSSSGKFVGTSYLPSEDVYWVPDSIGIHTSSNIGIGTTVAYASLTVFGDVFVSGIITATDYNSASDFNLKDNIKKIEDPLDKVLKLDGVNFEWKENGKKSIGVIAQEVEKILPELVSGDNIKTVNYNGIVGLLIECVKQQQKEIDELKRCINK